MSLQIGIVGLPNVGKSTTFNALTGAQNAQVANYPFCTIQPNRAVVPVPDERLSILQKMLVVPNAIPTTIEFVDLAGLVRGASQGEGLGNQFLGQIRNTDAILHVVRCFEDPNVVHTGPEIDPAADIDIINIELALADLAQLERKIERLESAVKGDKKLRPVLETASGLHTHLSTGFPARRFPEFQSPECQALLNELRLLTARPLIYLANVDEAGLSQEPASVDLVRRAAATDQAEVIVFCAGLEMELHSLTPEERRELLALAGVETSALEQVIRAGYHTLGLNSFFTRNQNEVRAWTVPCGATAPEAAGVIHTDFERGFIRAEVIPYPVFVAHGSDAAVKAAGQMRLEGKEYRIQDGDLIYFRFNV